MKVLVISTDRKLLDEGSPVLERHKKYAEQFENIDVLVFGGHGELRVGKLHVVGVGRLSALWKAQLLPMPNVITAQDPFENGFIALVISWWRGVPLHVQVHTDFLRADFVRHSFVNRIRRRLAWIVLRRAAGIRVVSESIKESLQSSSQTPLAATVLPIFVDIEKYVDLVRTKHPRFKIALLWVGRLEKEKCPLFAIQLLEIIRRNGHDAGLTVVGSGSEEEILKHYTRERGLERFVEFAGYQNDLTPFFATADLALVTSVYEGYGMFIIEALAAGIPVLSTDVGIAREAGAIVSERRRFGRALLDWISHGPRKAELQGYPYASEDEYVKAWCEDVRASRNR